MVRIGFRCIRLAFLLLALVNVSTVQAQEDFKQWAPTPPMGWNSWDCFGPTVTEAEVKANADYMAANLLSSGWEYIVVDIRWSVSNDKAHGYNQKDPQFNMDAYGRLLPAENRFPSAAGGKGFKPLADYIHSKGLKFGIHIMRGIPVVAVKQNLPVKGTSVKAADIHTTEHQCTWLRDMYGVDPSKKGAQEYYNGLFELYASWGVDFIKIDDLSSPIYFKEEINLIRNAIDRCGRKIVLSTSPGETPLDAASHVNTHANMWRTVGDFWDSWLQLKEHFAVFERWNAHRKPGAWPDGDMLPMGHIGIRAERGDDRMTRFTPAEQKTMMTLWAIFRSPLMFGGHLPDNDSLTNALITNKGMLQVLNHSTNNRQLFLNHKTAAWVADDPATGDKFLAVFNLADQEVAMAEKALWKGEQLSRTNPQQAASIALNGAKELYLVVNDGGDNISWDHANWINPVLHIGKDTLSLSAVSWTKATAGWGQPQNGKSVSGAALKVGEQEYANGIGTHSNSIISYKLPKAADSLTVLTALDAAGTQQNTGATVQFMVFTTNPTGPVPPDEAPVAVKLADLGMQRAAIIDLWSGKKLGSFSGEFAPIIPKHGAGLYRIQVAKK